MLTAEKAGRWPGNEARQTGIREQQLKRMPQSGPEAAAGSGGKRGPGEQQLKPLTQSGLGAAAEADAIGEQLCTESCPAPDYAR